MAIHEIGRSEVDGFPWEHCSGRSGIFLITVVNHKIVSGSVAGELAPFPYSIKSISFPVESLQKVISAIWTMVPGGGAPSPRHIHKGSHRRSEILLIVVVKSHRTEMPKLGFFDGEVSVGVGAIYSS